MGSISSDLASAQDGCEWGDCWGRWVFRKTARRGERNLSGGWRCGAGKISRGHGKEWGGGGVLGGAGFGRGCWGRWGSGGGSRILGEKFRNQRGGKATGVGGRR